MNYKLDLLQPIQEVFWHLTYCRSETINALKIPLDVMKFVYFHKTYVLSLLIIGLNITCTKLWVLWICPRPTSYLYLSQLKTWLALNDEIRVKLIKIWVHSLGQFGMKKSPVRKSYGYDTLQPVQFLSSVMSEYWLRQFLAHHSNSFLFVFNDKHIESAEGWLTVTLLKVASWVTSVNFMNTTMHDSAVISYKSWGKTAQDHSGLHLSSGLQ